VHVPPGSTETWVQCVSGRARRARRPRWPRPPGHSSSGASASGPAARRPCRWSARTADSSSPRSRPGRSRATAERWSRPPRRSERWRRRAPSWQRRAPGGACGVETSSKPRPWSPRVSAAIRHRSTRPARLDLVDQPQRQGTSRSRPPPPPFREQPNDQAGAVAGRDRLARARQQPEDPGDVPAGLRVGRDAHAPRDRGRTGVHARTLNHVAGGADDSIPFVLQPSERGARPLRDRRRGGRVLMGNGPAVDFAVHATTPHHTVPRPRKARRPAAPFPATRPRNVENAAEGLDAASPHVFGALAALGGSATDPMGHDRDQPSQTAAMADVNGSSR
jgi:hypothetical protein